jgi:hypothetical protein
MIRRFWEWCLHIKVTTWLRAACIITLVALALMVWSLFDPTLIPVLVGMSLAQVFGTIAFAIYGVVVFLDLARKRRGERARRLSQQTIGEAPK